MPLGSFCPDCLSAYRKAEILSQNRMAGVYLVLKARTKALHRSLVRRLSSRIGFVGEASSGNESSLLKRYEVASNQYLSMRSRCEVLRNTGQEAGRYLEVAETFRNLCGLSSEEYRRSDFYATSEMMALSGPSKTTDPNNRGIPWQEIENILRPLVEASIRIQCTHGRTRDAWSGMQTHISRQGDSFVRSNQVDWQRQGGRAAGGKFSFLM
jgi:hypothetical protein